MFNIVTVVYSSDFHALRLQALSLARFLKISPDNLKIYIILNDDISFKDELEHTVLPLYSIFSERCKILSRAELGCTNEYVHGWIQQQFYKLAVSNYIDSDGYLVLDSKNHLIREYDIESEMRHPLGWLRVNRNGHLAEGFQKSYEYFNLNYLNFIDRAPANVTPFRFYTSAVKELISSIEHREGSSFFDFFSKNKIHEFDLYSAYISSRRDFEYIESERNFVTLFKDKVVDMNNFNSMMFQALDLKIKFFAIHHDALRHLNNDQVARIRKFWVDCGLFENSDDASKYLCLV